MPTTTTGITITNNHFFGNNIHGAQMSVDVAIDGSFEGDGAFHGALGAEEQHLVGQITGNVLHATVTTSSRTCYYELTLKKQ